ncbi:hypothetical protein [Paraburkholderia elongata]|uniref:Uncharacterized protein n=1 Tax=Paraburkholderia elongata TaxID=2675747 RepID=A0A972SFM6_9BURK|nr:hypothetical protein [Paraburkholderia elongata]NPT53069.1 hypothetical protein [Paraburkholderia elongata]
MHPARVVRSTAIFVAMLYCVAGVAQVGIKDPEWDSPPTVSKLPHQLSVPRIENVTDEAEIGNFTSEGVTVSTLIIGNGERLYGAMGDARRVSDGLYLLPRDDDDEAWCDLKIQVESARIGIEGMPIKDDPSLFCPSYTMWLPAVRQ